MNRLETLGFVGRTAATGVHTLLPLGLRVHDRLSRIARDALVDCGANTVAFPTLQSPALWEQHTAYEFVVKDADLAVATMVEDASVMHLLTMSGGFGKWGRGRPRWSETRASRGRRCARRSRHHSVLPGAARVIS
ncbi:hypothetical protein ACIOHS_47485 [Streptomyces sp. NPDC088253]|uniref:hypothetical protein n=1 Tax=Streptomyces sp. NPDC088253 TaxID=3365846 RepID=UPI00380E9C18